jgi:hypothetical protein
MVSLLVKVFGTFSTIYLSLAKDSSQCQLACKLEANLFIKCKFQIILFSKSITNNATVSFWEISSWVIGYTNVQNSTQFPLLSKNTFKKSKCLRVLKTYLIVSPIPSVKKQRWLRRKVLSLWVSPSREKTQKSWKEDR